MKPAIIFVLLVLCIGLVFFSQRQPSDPEESVMPAPRNPRPTSPHANDPLPPPLRPILPADLGVRQPKAVTDHPARIREIIASGKSSELQSATLAWFHKDPLAVREWLNMQPDLEAFAPAVSAIAIHISETGDLENALTWAEQVPNESIRNDTYHGILSLAIRHKKITIDQLDLTGLPEEIIADLRSGAPGD